MVAVLPERWGSGAQRFTLSEPEFQVLWCLRCGVTSGFDQTKLAKRLAYSPAQVSSTVERLRVRGWIAQQSASGDRRRNLWHLSEAGGNVVREMLQTAHELRVDVDLTVVHPPVSGTGRRRPHEQQPINIVAHAVGLVGVLDLRVVGELYAAVLPPAGRSRGELHH